VYRLSLSLLLCVSAMAQQAETPKTARVAGRVVNLAGEPVRRPIVKLLGARILTQTADAEGGFAFENVAPGSYTLIAFRGGYSAQKYGAPAPLVQDCEYAESIASASITPIALLNLQRCFTRAPGVTLSLDAGQEMKDLKINLTPQATISGRVTNQDGEPVPKWEVRLMKTVHARGVRQLQDRDRTRTDPDGNFAFGNVAPGRYYLYALDTISLSAGLNAERQGKASPEADLATYYPSEAQAARAGPIDVKPGADLRGMDILVRRAQVYSIRGKVAAPQDSGVSDQILTLAAKGAPAAYWREAWARVYADGAFEFHKVAPGAYVLSGGRAWGNVGAAPPMFTRKEVTVSSADVQGLTLEMLPGLSLSGRVTLEGGKPGGWPSIWLQESEGSRSGGYAEPDPTGAFRFSRNIAPSTYVVNLLHPPSGTYVKSIRYGNHDALHSPLDLTGGAAGSLDVVLSSKVATITGTVKNAKDEAVTGVVVSVWPRVPLIAGGVKSGSTDQNGNFQILDLGPGDYFAAAWEDIDSGLLEYPEFLAQFQNEAAAVTLEDGGRASADLKLIPSKRVASEAAKLP
jgi:hypothetical protein